MIAVVILQIIAVNSELYSDCPTQLFIGSQRFVKRDTIWENDLPWDEKIQTSNPKLNKIRRSHLSRDIRYDRWELYDTNSNDKGRFFFTNF